MVSGNVSKHADATATPAWHPANDAALDQDLRLLSVYTDRNGARFWIITEADRPATTVLLPEEY